MTTTRRILLGQGLGVATSAWPLSVLAQPSPAVLPEGLVGEFHPGVGRRRPALLILGGSEGGLTSAAAGARLLAQEGYATLGLAYFKAPGLPKTLEGIPLEYFIRALDWLGAQPSVDPRRIGVMGGSKGAEAALLLASRDPRIRAVVAAAPSSVAWAGVDMANQARMMTIGSSWSWRGEPVSYVRYDFSGFKNGIRGIYDGSYAKAPPEASIPVEKINGPVLLISGGQDELWPASPMAAAMIARMDAARFRHKHVQLDYPEAGHGLYGPPSKPDPQLTPGARWLATQAAKSDSWPKTLAFLKDALRP